MNFFSRLAKQNKKIWIANILLLSTYFLIQTPGHLWLMSISQVNNAKPFSGAMMPLAFVPDWKKADYINQRGTLDYGVVNQNDLIPVPSIKNIMTDFNSMFTYLTVFRGRYMDENRTPNTGSHDGVDIRAPIGTPVFAIGHGKIVRSKDDPNNKYITIEHKDVKYQGKVGKYYSSYLHLSQVLVKPGEAVDKGTLIGRVGMTGYTTTPHLHLQVDNEDTPFYPYWPFTLTEAAEAGYSFFEGVDAGLNQDLIAKYSVDPLDFIQNAKGIDGVMNSAPELPAPRPIETIPQRETPIPTSPVTTPIVTVTNTPGNFVDVNYNNKFYTSISYFGRLNIIKGFDDGTFRSDKSVTRSELLGIVLKSLDIAPHGEIVTGIFQDVPSEHWVNPLISEAVKRKIVSTEREVFEPNRPVSRVEFLAILALASGEEIPLGITKSWTDVSWSHWSHKYAQFALKYKLIDDTEGNTFKPNQPISRGEIAEAVYRYLVAKNRAR
ncbi:peptidoglycan DD-metalloendopeptidase family protein [Candidatus Gracilibacteria bacterium]|nr:peptidoglycan DD-metalloendopeptidase family protein [Candidatus Gracilibacteria bacterium]